MVLVVEISGWGPKLRDDWIIGRIEECLRFGDVDGCEFGRISLPSRQCYKNSRVHRVQHVLKEEITFIS